MLQYTPLSVDPTVHLGLGHIFTSCMIQGAFLLALKMWNALFSHDMKRVWLLFRCNRFDPCIWALQGHALFVLERVYWRSRAGLCTKHKGNWTLPQRRGTQIHRESDRLFWINLNPILAFHRSTDQVSNRRIIPLCVTSGCMHLHVEEMGFKTKQSETKADPLA